MGITGVAVVVAVATFTLGYVIGSLPLSGLVGHAVGVGAHADGPADPGPADVWTLAGPGPGLLALVADLARGVLPVTLAVATFSWPAGWIAGLGAVLGAAWPALGRLRGGRSMAVLAGVLVTLEPTAGLAAALLALAVALIARLAGRPWRTPALVAAVGGYLVVVVVVELSVVRGVAVLALCLAAAARGGIARR